MEDDEVWAKEAPSMARHYEPPAFLVMMEILKLLARNGKVTVTMTIESARAEVSLSD